MVFLPLHLVSRPLSVLLASANIVPKNSYLQYRVILMYTKVAGTGSDREMNLEHRKRVKIHTCSFLSGDRVDLGLCTE
jgi:hypothetical protein